MALKRAYDAEAKQARRQAILDGADALFSEADQLPSVSEIAEAAGLAKGTVYLYFGTKEEIFAYLLLDGWQRVMDAASAPLAEQASAGRAVSTFIAGFAEALARSGNLMHLDALGKGVLEGNMTPEALSAFKEEFHQSMNHFGAMFDARLRLPSGRGAELLMRTHALTRGLWQSFEAPQDEELRSSKKANSFQAELTQALTEYWRGALKLDLQSPSLSA